MKRVIFAGLMMLGFVAAAGAETRREEDVGGAAVPRVVDGVSEWVYQWPGIYFEGRFRGDAVSLHMDDANNWFDVLVDGRAVMELERPRKTTVTLAHLGEGEHVIRLEKRTETQSATGAF